MASPLIKPLGSKMSVFYYFNKFISINFVMIKNNP
ncbi:MAG: hypothetical protein K0R51_961 [Cytophagaceae bacterium]|jgi:hypothetical protein|nr:hypothetical protein [Cytophagaceae bacterium]